MKRIVFDLFGTLVPSLGSPQISGPWEQGVSRILGVEIPGFADVFSESSHGREVGSLDFASCLESAAHVLGASPEQAQVNEAWEFSVESVRQALRLLRPQAEDTFAMLTGLGVELILCSNASEDAVEAFADCPWREYFSHTVFSCEVGYAKPDRAIYSLLGEPGFYVGDGGSSELFGAREAGFTPVQVPYYELGEVANVFRYPWDGLKVHGLLELSSLRLG